MCDVTRVVVEIKLAEVAVQMLFFHVMIYTIDDPLENEKITSVVFMLIITLEWTSPE